MRRVIFMGTPQTAVPSLKALAAFAGCELAAVVTQPARARRRGQIFAGPVQVAAEGLGLPVRTPVKIGEPEGLAALRESGAELGVVCAYGQILSREVLAALPLGWFNLHFSLLPRWRGASPVQAAILAGDAVTGVSLQKVVFRLDAGPIVAETPPLPIAPQDTGQSLGERLAEAAAGLLLETLPALLSGAAPQRDQDEAAATFCRTIPKGAGAVDWAAETAAAIERKVRAFFPWPGCHGFLGTRRLGLVKVSLAEGKPLGAPDAPPGTILAGGLVVAREGLVRLVEVKPEGKAVMEFPAFRNGFPGAVGARLTPAPVP